VGWGCNIRRTEVTVKTVKLYSNDESGHIAALVLSVLEVILSDIEMNRSVILTMSQSIHRV